ncbi:hypothetical protein LAG90_09005 [Marinilongibacter aquaticus]|uniref:hypothetical protein n=1 Tax=Marinilongibacter aquaticus TaxID=2975157 RepID=UPI0021BD5E91|nr:hypothetical protein [Marinilongibacter aquaticus]UBM60772.1 hypothetical protein LAG90_09005 [Marinilongibacter aquaticus]
MTRIKKNTSGVLFFLILCFSNILYAQSAERSMIDSIKANIEDLSHKVDSIDLEDATVYQLKKDILFNTKSVEELRQQMDDAYVDGVTKYFNIGVILASVLTGLFTFWSINHYNSTKIKDEIDKKVPVEVEKRLAEEVARVTTARIDDLETKFKEFSFERNLMNTCKILVINAKATKFPPLFINTLSRFNVIIEEEKKSKNVYEIEKPSDFYDISLINKANEYDLVIFEDTEPLGKWIGGAENTEYEKAIIEFISKVDEKVGFLYFGPFFSGRTSLETAAKSIEVSTGSKLDLMNYANSPNTLERGILDVLKTRYFKYKHTLNS